MLVNVMELTDTDTGVYAAGLPDQYCEREGRSMLFKVCNGLDLLLISCCP